MGITVHSLITKGGICVIDKIKDAITEPLEKENIKLLDVYLGEDERLKKEKILITEQTQYVPLWLLKKNKFHLKAFLLFNHEYSIP